MAERTTTLNNLSIKISMDSELIDRSNEISQRINQLRDSL